MRETKRSTTEIIEKMLSKDAHKIWEGSGEICSLSQNHDRIMEIAPYKERMMVATKDIDLGGAISTNDRFLKKAFEIIDFHVANKGCPCALLGQDSNLEYLVSDGYMQLMDTIHFANSNYVDYYLMRCNQCQKAYKVEERECHFFWWKWIPYDESH